MFEVLLAMLVISLMIPVTAGGLGAVLRFSKGLNQRTEAIALFETLLFDSSAEAGFHEEVPAGYAYSLEEEPSPDASGPVRVKASLEWREGKESMECVIYLPGP